MRLTLYATGAGEPRLLENGEIQAYDSAGFFPDGKRVLACGSAAGQLTRCYVQDLDGGAPRAITPPGTSHGLISPDGSSVLVRGPDERFFIYATTGGAPKSVQGTTSDDEVIRWSANGLSLLLNHKGKVPARIERLDLLTGKRTLVKELAPPSLSGVVNIRNIAFADNERSYAYTFDRVLCRMASVSGLK